MQKEWIYKELSEKDSKKPLIERLLAVRGITKKAEIKEFLNPLDIKLSEPTVFVDMEKALNRIKEAISNEQKILIYGDFDCDGITSTSILLKTFRKIGANVDYYIPDRDTEGHGMHSSTMMKIYAEKKPKLIITVDCGISNVNEIAKIKTFGVDVIVTDHHEAPEILPNVTAIINPKSPNSLDENLKINKIKELTSLAGCGVAFKLAQAILVEYKKPEFLLELLPLVAVGTVADLVPLIGENRYFVMRGMELIEQGKNKGLKKLSGKIKKEDEKLTSEKIAFGIAPRINATGRLDNVDIALNLLLSDDDIEISLNLQKLEELNAVRQALCDSIFLEADEIYKQQDQNSSAIVLSSKNWGIGIIGIVASRFVEKYYKPAFIMNYNEENKEYRCSARSVKGVNVFDVLSTNEELFKNFGGHEMAGGFGFEEETTSFDKVKQALNDTIKSMTEGMEFKPFINIDMELDEKDLDITIVDEISKLEPFGQSNPVPIFALKDAVIAEKILMGNDKNHLKLIVEKNGTKYTTIWWKKGDISLVKGDKLDVAFQPQINNFNNNISLQLMINDIKSELLKEEKPKNSNEVKVFDHRNKTDIYPQVEDYLKNSKMDILVFAENKNVVAELKPYKTLTEKIVTRQNIRKADSIMFFDYPTSEEDYENILKTISPKHIHYMNCNHFSFDEQDILRTFSGMLKFTCNSKDGVFEVKKATHFLGLTEEAILKLLEIMAQCKMIKVITNDINTPKIEFLANVELSHVIKCIEYREFKELLEEIVAYKEDLYKQDLK